MIVTESTTPFRSTAGLSPTTHPPRNPISPPPSLPPSPPRSAPNLLAALVRAPLPQWVISARTRAAAAPQAVKFGALFALCIMLAHAVATRGGTHTGADLAPSAGSPDMAQLGARAAQTTPRPGRLFEAGTRGALSAAVRHASLSVGPSRAARRVVVMTAATHHFSRELRNLACGVRAQTGRAPLLFALDVETARVGVRAGMSVFRPDVRAYSKVARARRGLLARALLGAAKENDDEGLPFAFRSDGFNRVSMQKLRAVRDAMAAGNGADILFTDADVVWCMNAALSIVKRATESGRSDVDLFIQNGRTTELHWPVEPNTGFFYVRNSQRTRRLLDHLVSRAAAARKEGLCDQFLFQREVCGINAHGRPVTGVTGRAVNASVTERQDVHRCVWGTGTKQVVVEQLPIRRFANGDQPFGVPFHRHAAGRLREACVDGELTVFHNNYCNARGKVERMNYHGLWLVRKADDGRCYPMRA